MLSYVSDYEAVTGNTVPAEDATAETAPVEAKVIVAPKPSKSKQPKTATVK